MIRSFRKGRLLRRGEDLIRQSGLFDENYYLSQVRNSYSILSNPIRHYLLRGERLGLAPMPLFDQQWYANENPDVATAAKDLFLHFVEYGETEHRSPHPLFDAVYYQSQSEVKIDRPLTHFLAAKGRSGYDPHPWFKTNRFLKFFDKDISNEMNPLIEFISSEKYELALSHVFHGAHYAKQLNETYIWKRHNVVQFLKHLRIERISPHPDFDVSSYLRETDKIFLSGANSFAGHILSGINKNPIDDLRQLPIRGKKIENNFEGNYSFNFLPLNSCRKKYPAPLTTLPLARGASTISVRRDNAIKDANGRFRLEFSNFSQNTGKNNTIVSIIMPVYKPPLVYLDRAIRSVIQQSSSNWELCIIDDCSQDDDLTQLLQSYADEDERIKVAAAVRNGGISRATNAALELATGDFIALLDNDDMISVDAIENLVREIEADPQIDFLYSDECLIDENDLVQGLFSKPNWSPTFLFSCMYTGHFTAYRKSLVSKLGGFRSEFDFSQDYDLALRISDTKPKVKHISKYLYGWRMISGSAAQGGKPFARFTNVAALQDTLDRRGYFGTALGLPMSNTVTRDATAYKPKVSIIIPSDNYENIMTTASSIIDHTDYSYFELIVVTNSKIANQIDNSALKSIVKCTRYDKPFNFSDKCNEGAAVATGDYFVFYNDDVRVISPNWIDSLLDIAVLDGVGAVAPKLLYEDGSIQHAGMITGVRRLVGTAFHTYPSNSVEHFGMAQYSREVSLLCGACIMTKREIFQKVEGFDSINTPINHSDVDLCFKIRACGLSCVYVATVSLKHIGHVSIGADEAKELSKPVRKDKADIFLLKRWSKECSYDPYFPPAMRDILYRDSQEYFQLFCGDRAIFSGQKVHTQRDILLVSHDLTNSGAPKIVLDLSRMFLNQGHYVCVLSPTDGPMRSRLTAIGVDVVVDDLALTQNLSVFDFAKNFDFAIANTIVGWPFVKQMGDVLPTYLYVHESELIDHFVNIYPDFLPALAYSAGVWTGSAKSGSYLEKHGFSDYTVIPYGIDDREHMSVQRAELAGLKNPPPMKVGLFGSIEPRKGQDLAVLGLMSLNEEERSQVSLSLFGRTLDKNYADAVKRIAEKDSSIVFVGEVGPSQYLECLNNVDIVIVPSRDDTLPLVSLDALASSKVLVVSRTTGTSEWLSHSESAIILEHNSPDEIGKVLQQLIRDRWSWQRLGRKGRECFEQNFSWSAFEKNVINHLQEQISKN